MIFWICCEKTFSYSMNYLFISEGGITNVSKKGSQPWGWRPRGCSLHFFPLAKLENKYRKVATSNTSRLEAHAGIFRLLMKGIFDPFCTVTFLTKIWFPNLWCALVLTTLQYSRKRFEDNYSNRELFYVLKPNFDLRRPQKPHWGCNWKENCYQISVTMSWKM